MDPTAIKENIVKKSKKKVDVIAPQPKKDDNKEDKKEKKPEKDKNQPSDNNKQEKKPKEVLSGFLLPFSILIFGNQIAAFACWFWIEVHSNQHPCKKFITSLLFK